MAKSSVVPLQGDDFIFTTLLLMLLLIKSSSNECGEQLSCGPDEPRIRFPFQLVKGTKDVCAYPGFCLYCTQNNDTMLQLPTIKLRVTQIDYQNQKIQLKDPQNCLPVNFLKLDTLDIRPYQFELPYKNQLSYFDCSSVGRPHLRNRYQIDSSSQDMLSCPFYASNAYDSVLELDLTSCTRKFDFYAPVWAESLQTNSLDLTWTKPDCTMCEAKGNRCRWKNNNNTENGVECFKCSKGKQKGFHLPLTFIFSASGSILMGLLTIVGFKIFSYFRRKEEDQARVEKFLEDYRAEKPTRLTYADVKRITGGYKEKLGEGTHGAVFRGKLSDEILVAVKILNNTEGEGNEFINEVEIMGKIHHINVVRLIGFCAEGLHRALVYHLFPNGSLQSFIFPSHERDHFLGWEKLQQIALGIAKGIEYLHQGCNRPIIHFDIYTGGTLKYLSALLCRPSKPSAHLPRQEPPRLSYRSSRQGCRAEDLRYTFTRLGTTVEPRTSNAPALGSVPLPSRRPRMHPPSARHPCRAEDQCRDENPLHVFPFGAIHLPSDTCPLINALRMKKH